MFFVFIFCAANLARRSTSLDARPRLTWTRWRGCLLGMIVDWIDDTNALFWKKVTFWEIWIHFESQHWSHNICQVPLGVLGRQTQFTCVGFECRKMGLGPKDVAEYVSSASNTGASIAAIAAFIYDHQERKFPTRSQKWQGSPVTIWDPSLTLRSLFLPGRQRGRKGPVLRGNGRRASASGGVQEPESAGGASAPQWGAWLWGPNVGRCWEAAPWGNGRWVA